MKGEKGITNNFIWVSIERFGMLGIQFIGTVVLSRFLDPSEYGIMGTLAIFIAISNMLIDSGMGGALIREKVVTNVDYSTLFYYNVFISTLIYIVLYVISPYIALFYEQPDIKSILRVLSLAVVFNSLSIVQRIHLTRELSFKVMALVTVLSSLLGVILSVFFAFKGYGIWALVFQQVMQSLLLSLFYFFTVRFIPSLIFDVVSFKKQFLFGFHLLLSNFLNVINTNVVSSIIGKVFSIHQTGLFVQSNKLYNLPTGIIATIVDKAVFPILSKVAINQDVKGKIVKINRCIYLFTFPMFLMASILSKQIIMLLFGKQWIGAAWIFSILCISGIFLIIKALLRNVLKTIGETSSISRLEFFSMIIGLFILVLSIILSFEAMLWGIVLSNFFSMVLYMVRVSKKVGYTIGLQFRDMLTFLGISLCPSILVYGYVFFYEDKFGYFLLLTTGSFLGLFSLILCCLIVRNEEFLTLYRRLLNKNRYLAI